MQSFDPAEFMKEIFLTFPADFWIPLFFFNLNHTCSIFWDLRNLQEQVKKAFCYQKLLWPFTVRINSSSDLNRFWKSSAFSFSWSLEQFFLTVGQNNFWKQNTIYDFLFKLFFLFPFHISRLSWLLDCGKFFCSVHMMCVKKELDMCHFLECFAIFLHAWASSPPAAWKWKDSMYALKRLGLWSFLVC